MTDTKKVTLKPPKRAKSTAGKKCETQLHTRKHLLMAHDLALFTMTFRCVLEVERKFRSLAVRELSRTGGIPHFKSLQRLPVQNIHDAYYDRANLLSSAGAWIRKRDGAWQAKIKKGGNFANSRFEELCDVAEISAYVKRITGVNGSETSNFELVPTATFSTKRETWVADEHFHIVLDTMDFGFEVGEVELQQVLKGDQGEAPTEQEKSVAVQEMDERVSGFMKHYSWAFSPGEPKGKLTAYFERFGYPKV